MVYGNHVYEVEWTIVIVRLGLINGMPVNWRYNSWPFIPPWDDTEKLYLLWMYFNLGSGIPITIIWVKADDQDLHFAACSIHGVLELSGGIVLSELPYFRLVHGQDEAIWRLNLNFGSSSFWRMEIWNSIAATLASIMFPGMTDIYWYDSMSLESIY